MSWLRANVDRVRGLLESGASARGHPMRDQGRSGLPDGVPDAEPASAITTPLRSHEPEDAPKPSAPDEEHDRAVGLGVAQMLAYGKDWVFRRTETFEFISASTVRRQVGVDFQFPRWASEDMDMDTEAVDEMVASCRQHGVAIYVPLLTLEKAKLTNVDVLDEDGRTLPLLTTAQNGRIGGYALLGVALGVAYRARWESVDGDVVDAIADVAKLPSVDAKLLLSCLRDGVAAHADAVAERVSDGHVGRTADKSSLATHTENLGKLSEAARAQARQLLDDNLLGNLAEKLANDFIVLVPLSDDPYARRVFKFRYEEPLTVPDGHREAPVRKRAWWWVAERCSWRLKEFSFSRIPVGTTESHHVEMVAPEDTDIVRGVFQAYTPPPKPVGELVGSVHAAAPASGLQGADAPKPDAVDRIDGTNPRRGHMQIRAVAPQAYATARVAFRASPAGLVNAALLVTLLNAFIFWAGLSHVDDAPQEDAAAAILLAGPTLLAVYIARPGEHELVSMMLSGVRAMVGASGFLMFLMAAGFAFGYNVGNGVELQDVWRWLRWPAAALALGVGWSWVKVHWPSLPSSLRAHPRQSAAAVAAALFGGVVIGGVLARPLLPASAGHETLNVPVWLGWVGLGAFALAVAALAYLTAARRLRAPH